MVLKGSISEDGSGEYHPKENGSAEKGQDSNWSEKAEQWADAAQRKAEHWFNRVSPKCESAIGAVQGVCTVFLRRFFRKETPQETDVDVFNGHAERTFELKRLLPLAVCCLVFGWLWWADSDSLFDQSTSRWAILPISGIALYASTRSILYFIRPKQHHWIQWCVVCFIVATIGVFLLLQFQEFAEMVRENPKRYIHGRMGSFFLIVKYIGWCYAKTESSNPIEVFFGYVCGVGLCEEMIKLLPVAILIGLKRGRRLDIDLSYRSLLMLGFFSGLGFGIGEALSDQYSIPENPLFSCQITRWFACVPSHAIYSTIDAAFLWLFFRRISQWKANAETVDYVIAGWVVVGSYALCVATVALLHGIYDVFSGIEHFGVFADGGSLILLWWVVRRTIRERNEAIAPTTSAFFDFNPLTIRMFGKTHLKIFLCIPLAVSIYRQVCCM